MFKNLKIISLILLCSCTVANNEKIYTDLIPTIRNKGEGSIASIQEKNLFVCNIDEKEGPQNYCDKDGKLFNGTITQNYDDIKIQYIFKNGKPVKEKDFENGKLVSSSNIKITFPIDLPRIYSTKYYDENGKISSEYKFDNGEAKSTLKTFCPDGSIEKEIKISQTTDNRNIAVTKQTTYKKFKADGWSLPITKFEHLTLKLNPKYPSLKKEDFRTMGFYTGKVDILNCNDEVVETLNFKNGKKVD
ncbi:MAG: hypothetical protein IJ473_01780 [Alphaproteobacteria bacterium]|nr:hypothetical protein [Alphaproteobacteria bacterium]